MKMPWSFLTRRRSADPSPDEIEEVKEAFGTDEEAAEPFDQQPVAVTSSVGRAEPEANLREASESMVPGEGRREETEDSVAQTAEVQSPPLAVKPTSRRNPARREQSGLVAVPARDSSAPLLQAAPKIKLSIPEPTPNENFITDVSALDLEINILRQELSKKLRLQNAQLREMLQRFDLP